MRREELVERVVVVDKKSGRIAFVLTPLTDYIKLIKETGRKPEEFIVARLLLSSYDLEDGQLLECSNIPVYECWEKLVKAVARDYGRVVEPW